MDILGDSGVAVKKFSNNATNIFLEHWSTDTPKLMDFFFDFPGFTVVKIVCSESYISGYL